MSTLAPWAERALSTARAHSRAVLPRSNRSPGKQQQCMSSSFLNKQHGKQLCSKSGLSIAQTSKRSLIHEVYPFAGLSRPRTILPLLARSFSGTSHARLPGPFRKAEEVEEQAKTGPENGKDNVKTAASKTPPEQSKPGTPGKLSDEATVDNKTTGADLKRLVWIARPEARWLAVAIVLLALSASVTMTIPFSVGRIIDAAGKGGMVDIGSFSLTLTQFLTGIAVILTLGSAASFSRNVLMKIIGERVIARLRSQLYRRTYSQDAQFFDINPVGDLISRLGSDTVIVGDSVTQNLAYAVRATFNTIAGLTIMIYTSAQLTGMMLVVLPVMGGVSIVFSRILQRLSKTIQENIGTLTKIAEERLGNVKTSQAFVGERQEVNRYNKQIRKIFQLKKKESILTSTFLTSTIWTGNVSFLVMLAVGNNFIQSGAMTTGDLTSFVMYAMFAASGLMDFFYTYTDLMRGAGAATRLFELQDTKAQIKNTVGSRVKSAQGNVKFTDVHFAYPTRQDVKIFNGLNFEIPSGTNACIVGPSGRGKSTIGTLLLRFYNPVSGSITVNDVDISSMNAKSLRRRIGVVAQEPVLFSGTIAENIAYGMPSATEDEIRQAARVANCIFIDNLPLGLETQVGARGSQLSGGQKQRVAIARAVLKQPDILILDEATSALDAESETLVNQALGKLFEGNMTTISIAHRLSTIEKADLIIVLNDAGEVAETGTYSQLSQDINSEFNRLMENQMRPMPKAAEAEAEEETVLADEGVIADPDAMEEMQKRKTAKQDKE
ncbi:ATP-binding cassette permease mdl1 [Lecanicillium sp. MT-2017a]|nr:ATP-binding cassette permease mdl1 [Lecanicillium sp. MT-2017a]